MIRLTLKALSLSALILLASCADNRPAENPAQSPIAEQSSTSSEETGEANSAESPAAAPTPKVATDRPELDFRVKGNDNSWSMEMDFEGKLEFNYSGSKRLATAPAGMDKLTDSKKIFQFADGSMMEWECVKSNCLPNEGGFPWLYSVRVAFYVDSDAEPVYLEGCGTALGKTALGGKWIFADLGGIQPPVGAQGKANIEFNIKARQISGYDGCNRFSSTLEMSDNRFKIGPVASTKMACPGVEGSMELVQGLSNSEFTFSIQNSLMLFLVKDGETWVLEKSLNL